MSSISEPRAAGPRALEPDSFRAPAAEVQRLIDRNFMRLMPLLVFGYILNFLDRTNIALAKAALQTDVGISPQMYGFGAGLFFLVYAACEVPSNLILRKVGARRWIARIMATWGLVSMGMCLVKGPSSFYLLRVLLGVAEAGLFPGVLYYLTTWFGPREQARATGYFLMGVSMANVIGGPVGGALLGLNGTAGLAGWQWLFLVEGVPAVLFAVVVLTVLPEGPAKARWLSDDEKAVVLAEQRRGREGGGDTHLSKAFFHPQVLLAILVYFLHQIAFYGVTFFLPAIIRSWGKLSELQIGLLTGLPWLCAFIGSGTLPWLAMKGGWSRLLMTGGCFLLALCLLAPLAFPPALALGVFCVGMAVVSPIQAVVFTYPPARFEGAALAAGLGFLNALGVTGGFVGPFIMGAIEQGTGKASGGLIFMAAAMALGGIASLFLRYPHQDRARSVA
ncbi:MAG TPA: MFS transporter [Caulobacteraceae bacterium]|jgi:MFS family permease